MLVVCFVIIRLFIDAQKVRKKMGLFDGAIATRNLKKAVFLSFNISVLFLGYSLHKANFYMFFVAQRTKRPSHEKKQS